MFAYELNGVSAIITVEKNCNIDLLCENERSKSNATAFYGNEKNLNKVVELNETFAKNIQKYDVVLNAGGHAVILNFVNAESLSKKSPALFQSLVKVDEYNRKYTYNRRFEDIILFNMARSRILGTNRFTSLSCDGALPIYDNHVEINLSPKWSAEFKKLCLKKYITIGSNGGAFNRHTVKEWPTRYYTEFVSLLKTKMPDIKVVQIGGGCN